MNSGYSPKRFGGIRHTKAAADEKIWKALPVKGDPNAGGLLQVAHHLAERRGVRLQPSAHPVRRAVTVGLPRCRRQDRPGPGHQSAFTFADAYGRAAFRGDLHDAFINFHFDEIALRIDIETRPDRCDFHIIGDDREGAFGVLGDLEEALPVQSDASSSAVEGKASLAFSIQTHHRAVSQTHGVNDARLAALLLACQKGRQGQGQRRHARARARQTQRQKASTAQEGGLVTGKRPVPGARFGVPMAAAAFRHPILREGRVMSVEET